MNLKEGKHTSGMVTGSMYKEQTQVVCSNAACVQHLVYTSTYQVYFCDAAGATYFLPSAQIGAYNPQGTPGLLDLHVVREFLRNHTSQDQRNPLSVTRNAV